MCESAKAMDLRLERCSLSMCVSDEEWKERKGL